LLEDVRPLQLTNACDDQQDQEGVDNGHDRRRQGADDVLEGLDPPEEPNDPGDRRAELSKAYAFNAMWVRGGTKRN
jgi:hypothetical protein